MPLEQVISANLDLMFPEAPPTETYLFRVTRGAEGERQAALDANELLDEPGSIVQLVSSELKARKFAGVVRLEVEPEMPKKLVKWLAEQLVAQLPPTHAVWCHTGPDRRARSSVRRTPPLIGPDPGPACLPFPPAEARR